MASNEIKRFELNEKLSLLFKKASDGEGNYPSDLIQKGLLLACMDEDLSEEGVGFGVPIFMNRDNAVFPGSANITSTCSGNDVIIDIHYDLNLVEKMVIRGEKIQNNNFYKIKEYFSKLHREYPGSRKILTGTSNLLRKIFGLKTGFERVSSFGIVHVSYIIRANENSIYISVNPYTGIECKPSEIMIMNELGASFFNNYTDSNGIRLTGEAIGTWDEIYTEEASFWDLVHNIEYTLDKVEGARMFRGREHVKGRLSWSGIAYSISPGRNFNYKVIFRMLK